MFESIHVNKKQKNYEYLYDFAKLSCQAFDFFFSNLFFEFKLVVDNIDYPKGFYF